VVDHFAEDYLNVLTLAKTEPEKSVIDSNTLQYFAIDVWAYDIAAPGVGCSGVQPTVTASAPSSSPTTTKTAPVVSISP
jgi:hypothetical protein